MSFDEIELETDPDLFVASISNKPIIKEIADSIRRKLGFVTPNISWDEQPLIFERTIIPPEI